MPRYARALHVFRRDLRCADNVALRTACEKAGEVVGVFIIDPRQAGEENQYRGAHSLQFLKESLEDLDQDLRQRGSRLYVYEGVAEKVLPRITRELNAQLVTYNHDYTPFSKNRDEAMGCALLAEGVAVEAADDALLTRPGSVLTGAMTPYSVFTPFYRAASVREVSKPKGAPRSCFVHPHAKDAGMEAVRRLTGSRASLAAVGGRTEGKKRLAAIEEKARYDTRRDVMAEDGTTLLSPYLKLGCISVREAYWTIREALGGAHAPLTRQLYWRDFFSHIAFFHPDVFGKSFKPQYDRVRWSEPGGGFEKWKEGKTGFPIVDAGMRQLRETGWMHNRARMITASFLVKDLHIDWRLGERHFAQQLIDYDPAVNNGSWQWVAGTGADAAPYFRILNPWLQQKKYDPDAAYIRRFVPELSGVSVGDVHAWERAHEKHPHTQYPAPILNHREEAEEAKRRFGRVLK